MSLKIFKNKNTDLYKQGFTLVEIMVATSIFMLIMLAALGSLIVSSDAAKKAQALRTAMDNVSFAMESMTRSLRMGTDYTCMTSSTFSLPGSAQADCPVSSSGGSAIIYTPAYDGTKRDAAYVVNARGDGTSVLQRCYAGGSCLDMVSSNVDIQKLTFFVSGSHSASNGPDDQTQPSIYILVKGVVTIKGQANTFAVQTTVTQRTTEQ